MSEHRWLWGILVYIDDHEADRIAAGERRTFRKLDPFGSEVQGAAVFCENCQRPYVDCHDEPCFDAKGRRASSLVLPPGLR